MGYAVCLLLHGVLITKNVYNELRFLALRFELSLACASGLNEFWRELFEETGLKFTLPKCQIKEVDSDGGQ